MPSASLRGSRQPRTVEDIVEDYVGRRGALLKALTSDLDSLYELCDPSAENLCLYGHTDGTWEVDLPADQVPAEMPEPTLGINFARDGMSKQEWAFLVAVHSDCWLVAVAFYFAFRLDAQARLKLHRGMNCLPTLFEVVTSEYQYSNGTREGSKRPKRRRQMAYDGSSHERNPDGRLLNYRDIEASLKGRQAELYWPDDDKWYLVEIHSVSSRQRQAKIQYHSSGEYEELDLDEIIREGHMSIL